MSTSSNPRYFGGSAESDLSVDRRELRDEIRRKYEDVALAPTGGFHFNTGRPNAERCGYDLVAVDRLPPAVVESFAGVANPFVDLGAGAGFDTFLASALRITVPEVSEP